MSSPVTIVIPVLPGQDLYVESTLRHLQKLGVSNWGRVVVIASTTDSFSSFEKECEWIQSEKTETWGELLMRGLHRARRNGSAELMWLAPGALPREGMLSRLHQITRCRKAITAPGKIIYPCRIRKSGGFLKTLFNLVPVSFEKGKLVNCDATSEVCGCIPMSSIHFPVQGETSAEVDFWNAQDLGLILTSNGIPCLVDGECEVDVLPIHTLETDSWLLSNRSVSEIWKALKNPASPINFKRRLRYFARHWGLFGCIAAMTPVMRLVTISVIRALVPLKALRQIYGRRSSAWRIQQLHDHKPATETVS